MKPIDLKVAIVRSVLNQKQIAERVGIDHTSFNKMVNGTRPLKKQVEEALIRLFPELSDNRHEN